MKVTYLRDSGPTLCRIVDLEDGDEGYIAAWGEHKRCVGNQVKFYWEEDRRQWRLQHIHHKGTWGAWDRTRSGTNDWTSNWNFAVMVENR